MYKTACLLDNINVLALASSDQRGRQGCPNKIPLETWEETRSPGPSVVMAVSMIDYPSLHMHASCMFGYIPFSKCMFGEAISSTDDYLFLPQLRAETTSRTLHYLLLIDRSDPAVTRKDAHYISDLYV